MVAEGSYRRGQKTQESISPVSETMELPGWQGRGKLFLWEPELRGNADTEVEQAMRALAKESPFRSRTVMDLE